MDFERATLIPNHCRYTETSNAKSRHSSTHFKFDFGKDEYPSASRWRNFYGPVTYSNANGVEFNHTLMLSPIQCYYSHPMIGGLQEYKTFLYELTKAHTENIWNDGETKFKRLINASVLFSPVFEKKIISRSEYGLLSDAQKATHRAQAQPRVWSCQNKAEFLQIFRDKNGELYNPVIFSVEKYFCRELGRYSFELQDNNDLHVTKINSGKFVISREKTEPLPDLDI